MAYNYPDWITYAPLQRNWDVVRAHHTSKLCSIKAIAIHFINAPGQSAMACRSTFQSRSELADLKEQGSPYVGSQFIIDDGKTIATAPHPFYAVWHVSEEQSRAANPNYWAQNQTLFPRRNPSYYTIGIEHAHPDNTGKFTPAVLKRSHQLVNWLLKEFGANLLIGRHYDFTGKACPLYCAPCITGNINTRDGLVPEFPNEVMERYVKNGRWENLLKYYKQSNANNLPDGWA